MLLKKARSIGVGQPIVIRDGQPEPSRRMRGKHRQWSYTNFVGKILEIHKDAFKVLDLDKSSGHNIVTKWYSDTSRVTISGRNLYFSRRDRK